MTQTLGTFGRTMARRLILTSNTYRFATELPLLRTAARLAGGNLGTLMDAGAGGGYYSRTFLADGLCDRIVCVEPFDDNFAILQAACRALGERARAIHSAIETTGEPDASVNTVLCTQVLEHIEDDGAVVAEFRRLLRSGGHAIITVPHPPEPFEQPGHVREGYTQETLGRLFARERFRAVHFDWGQTRTTMKRFLVLRRVARWWPAIPPGLWAREDRRSCESRRDDQPYILLGLFQRED